MMIIVTIIIIICVYIYIYVHCMFNNIIIVVDDPIEGQPHYSIIYCDMIC